MTKQPAVYLMASSPNGTLYAGVTSDLLKRVHEHRTHTTEGFTKRYNVTRLVWYELHGELLFAIEREKQIKKWKRGWKVKLIEVNNPNWFDLWLEISGSELEQSPPRAGFPPTRE